MFRCQTRNGRRKMTTSRNTHNDVFRRRRILDQTTQCHKKPSKHIRFLRTLYGNTFRNFVHDYIDGLKSRTIELFIRVTTRKKKSSKQGLNRFVGFHNDISKQRGVLFQNLQRVQCKCVSFQVAVKIQCLEHVRV